MPGGARLSRCRRRRRRSMLRCPAVDAGGGTSAPIGNPAAAPGAPPRAHPWLAPAAACLAAGCTAPPRRGQAGRRRSTLHAAQPVRARNRRLQQVRPRLERNGRGPAPGGRSAAVASPPCRPRRPRCHSRRRVTTCCGPHAPTRSLNRLTFEFECDPAGDRRLLCCWRPGRAAAASLHMAGEERTAGGAAASE